MSLINLNSKIQRRLGSALSVHGLGVSDFLVLSQLEDAPNQRMRRVDLAEKVGLSASGVTRLLNPMEKIGLVHKEASARDARVSLVSLSSAGKRTLNEIEVAVNDAAQTLLKSLDADQQSELCSLVQSVA